MKADIEKKFGTPSQSRPKETEQDAMQNEVSSQPSAESETKEQPELDASGTAEEESAEDVTSDSLEVYKGDERRKEVAKC